MTPEQTPVPVVYECADASAVAGCYRGFVPDPVVMDADGYAPSFACPAANGTADGSSDIAMKAFFERYGFVVIRDVLSPAAIAATKNDIFALAGYGNKGGKRAAAAIWYGLWVIIVAAVAAAGVGVVRGALWQLAVTVAGMGLLMFTVMQSMRQGSGEISPPGLTELDAMSWNKISGSKYNTARGFLGFEPPWSIPAWRNRLAPSLYRACSKLFGREDLVVKLDRYGLMRPTVFVGDDGAMVRRTEWRTAGKWIHWDQNPWEEPDFARIQVVLAISDHRTDTGGFQCVPGFTRHWRAWAAANKRQAGSLVSVPDEVRCVPRSDRSDPAARF